MNNNKCMNKSNDEGKNSLSKSELSYGNQSNSDKISNTEKNLLE